MRKTWMVLFILFVFVALAACAGMTKGGEKVYRVRGTVDVYEPGKMIRLAENMEVEGFTTDYGESNVILRAKNPGEFTYTITPATEVKGTVEKGKRVLIRYTASGPESATTKTAVSIDVK